MPRLAAPNSCDKCKWECQPVVLTSRGYHRYTCLAIANMFMRSEAGNLGVATKSSDTRSKRVSSLATVREDGQDGAVKKNLIKFFMHLFIKVSTKLALIVAR